MDLTAGNIPSANSTGAPYVAGNFAPLKSEVTTFDLEVIGRVPEELTGRPVFGSAWPPSSGSTPTSDT